MKSCSPPTCKNAGFEQPFDVGSRFEFWPLNGHESCAFMDDILRRVREISKNDAFIIPVDR